MAKYWIYNKTSVLKYSNCQTILSLKKKLGKIIFGSSTVRMLLPNRPKFGKRKQNFFAVKMHIYEVQCRKFIKIRALWLLFGKKSLIPIFFFFFLFAISYVIPLVQNPYTGDIFMPMITNFMQFEIHKQRNSSAVIMI